MAIKPDDQAIGALYREADSAEPSAELDRAILQAARAAVAPPALPAAGWRRWRLHLPVLASLFMVALLGLLISFEQPEAPSIGQIALNEAVVPVPPASLARRAESAAPVPAESRARMADAAPPRAAARMEPPAQEAEMKEERARPAAPPMAASAPAANTLSSNADAGAPAMDKATASPPGEARAAARQAAAPASIPVQPASEWLAAIQQLIDKERIEEAKASLQAFQKAYPAATVPTAMRQRLKP